MAPLGSGWKVGRDTERYPRNASNTKKSPFGDPATYPHQREFVIRSNKGIDASLEALERTVTPEAHTYFRRIVQVTQSELEKLLVYKIQQLFDPVAPQLAAEIASDELGHPLATKLRLPGASAASHLSVAEGCRGRHREMAGILPSESCRGLPSKQDRAAAEGRDLTQHLVGLVGKILADFGCFADAILRWQTSKRCDNPLSLNGVDAVEQSDVEGGPGSDIGLKELLERLDRQDHQNSTLEAKYTSVSTVLREDRRAFMRERLVWQEQKNRLKAAMGSRIDPAIRDILKQDVQFYYNEGDPVNRKEEPEEDLDELRNRYEDVITALKKEFAEVEANMEELMFGLKAKIKSLGQQIEDMRAMKKESKQEVVHEEVDTSHLDDLIRQLREEMSALRAEIKAAEAANDALRSQLEEAQARLTDALNRPPPPPAPSATPTTITQHVEPIITKAPETKTLVKQQDNSSQVSANDFSSPAPRLKKESLASMTIQVPPVDAVDESAALRRELSELRAQLQQRRDELLEAKAREAAAEAKRVADAENCICHCKRLEDAEKKLAAAVALANKMAAEAAAARVPAAETESPGACCVAAVDRAQLEFDKQTQTHFEGLIEKAKGSIKRAPQHPVSDSATQTDDWQPEKDHSGDAFFLQKIEVLEAEIVRLKALMLGLQRQAAELHEQVSDLKRKVKILEEAAKAIVDTFTLPQKKQEKKKTMGGGWSTTTRKVIQGVAATQAFQINSAGKHVALENEFKLQIPLSARSDPLTSARGTSLLEDTQYRDNLSPDRKDSGAPLDYRAAPGKGPDTFCLNFLAMAAATPASPAAGGGTTTAVGQGGGTTTAVGQGSGTTTAVGQGSGTTTTVGQGGGTAADAARAAARAEDPEESQLQTSARAAVAIAQTAIATVHRTSQAAAATVHSTSTALVASAAVQAKAIPLLWQAIPAISMPVSGCATSTPVQASTLEADQRASYGGGFSVLDSTGWKGTDGMTEELSRSSLLAPLEATAAHQGSYLPVASTQRQQKRPPSAAAGMQKKDRLRTLSVSDSVAQVGDTSPAAFRAPSAYNVGASSPDRVSSASRIRSEQLIRGLAPCSSSPQIQKRHNILHGPAERRSRPQSALAPLQAHSLQSNQGVHRQKHERNQYISSLFDG